MFFHETERNLLRMKKCISILTILLITVSLSGCSVNINFEEIIDSTTNRLAESTTEYVKEQIAKKKDEISGKFDQWKSRLLRKCPHEPTVYDENNNTITCECGKITVNSDLSEFILYIYSNSEENEKIENVEELSDSISSLVALCDKVDTGAIYYKELLENHPKDAKIFTKEYFEDQKDFLDKASTLLQVFDATLDLYKYHSLSDNRSDIDNHEILIDVLKDCTGFIPYVGNYFTESLDCISIGLDLLSEGRDYTIVRYAVIDQALANGPLCNVKNYENLQERYNWEKGPSLSELLEADLPDELITVLIPYIEFRLEYEFRILTGRNLGDLINFNTSEN